jgi:ABC-type sulfate/molybdate transport systems ATPase subunit
MLAIDVEAQVGAMALRAALPADGGTTVVIGPNGAGKTSLLRCVLGAVRPRRGTIALDERPLFCSRQGVDTPTEHRRLGYVPQRYALFPHMTARANVGFGIRGVDRRTRRERVMELLEDLGIAHLADRRTPSLSGGEAQRVALARALAIGPRALLLDEPMAALDAGARRKVRRFLSVRLRAIGIPTLVVSHDVDDVEALGGRVAVLEAGRIVQIGALEALRKSPATPFVEEFLDAAPESPPAAVGEVRAWS